MTNTTANDEGTVFIVITQQGGDITDLEVLSSRPKWNLLDNNQRCFEGNINGGDSIELHLCQFEGCDQLSTEFIEVNSEEGVNVCADHEDQYWNEWDAKMGALPSLTTKTPTPLLDWLETRPWPEGEE